MGLVVIGHTFPHVMLGQVGPAKMLAYMGRRLLGPLNRVYHMGCGCPEGTILLTYTVLCESMKEQNRKKIFILDFNVIAMPLLYGYFLPMKGANGQILGKYSDV